jgi:hypothetical protein
MNVLKHKYSFFIFLFLFLSFYNNRLYIQNDKISEALVVGRLIESERNGIFSHSGLTGYVTDSIHFDDYNYNAKLQFEILNKSKKSDSYLAFKSYDSHNGGQAIIYSILNKISPFNLETNIRLFKLLNIALLSLILSILAMWTNRNFGIIPCITFLSLLSITSWIINFSSSLWWCLWVLYIPFIVGLLYLEKQTIITYKQEKKLLFFLYLSIVFKCFITGFEYISTTFVVGFLPILYYLIKNKIALLKLVSMGLKYLLIFTCSILTSLLILVYQIQQQKGSFNAGIQHVLDTFLKRTSNVVIEGKTANLSSNSYIQIILKYLNGNMFSWSNIKIPFIVMVAIVFISCCILLITNTNKNKAIVLTTIASILAPLSWYIVFIQHSAIHLHLNFIVWYVPFLPLGYICIGLVFKFFGERINKSKL